MRKYIRIAGSTIILCLMLSMLTACGSGGGKGRKDIIGKWQVGSFEANTGENQNMLQQLQVMAAQMLFGNGATVEFIDDKKVSLSNMVSEYEIFEGGDRIQIGSQNNNDTPLLFNLSVNGDVMVLENSMKITLYKEGSSLSNTGADTNSKTDDKTDNRTGDNGPKGQNDALTQEMDALKNQNAELKNQIKVLQEELEQYKAIVDRRELVTLDSSIEEKFSNAYALDETVTIGELEAKFSNIAYPDNYEGLVPQAGELISGAVDIKNIGLKTADCRNYLIHIVDKEGRKYNKGLYNNNIEYIYHSKKAQKAPKPRRLFLLHTSIKWKAYLTYGELPIILKMESLLSVVYTAR